MTLTRRFMVYLRNVAYSAAHHHGWARQRISSSHPRLSPPHVALTDLFHRYDLLRSQRTMPSDLMLTCRECGKGFSFTAIQRADHAHRGFTNQPTRCPDCRANRRAARPITQRSSNGGTRQSYPAICASCGANTTLPFNPSRDRPGYCPSCFQARQQGTQPAGTNKATHDPEEWTGESIVDTSDPATVFHGLTLQATTRTAIAGMGISTPTPIQEETIPFLMAGRDVIGQARTGSGKTLAFAIPIVERCDPSVRGVQAFVLVPTRELAIQVANVTEVLAANRRLKVTLLYGGRSLEPERRALARRCSSGHRNTGKDTGPSA